jgi:enoyl-CoA hydratase/carnithine racemase
LLEYDGPIAIVTNNRPEKHNAWSDEMYDRLWEILAELHERSDVRAIVWRGAGKSFGAGRDVSEMGRRTEDVSQLEFMERGHRGAGQLLTLPAPMIAALKGWVIGGSFEHALLCDIRVAAESTKLRLPEVMHGVVPDCGGTARLFQMAGHGLVADLALTGRVMTAAEALQHGIVSRVVPDDELEAVSLEMARSIASHPAFTVKMFRRVLSQLATPTVQQSMVEEVLTQSMTMASDDFAEMRAARAEERSPRYRGR